MFADGPESSKRMAGTGPARSGAKPASHSGQRQIPARQRGECKYQRGKGNQLASTRDSVYGECCVKSLWYDGIMMGQNFSS